MFGTLIAAFAPQKFATARYWQRGALIVCFWMAIALSAGFCCHPSPVGGARLVCYGQPRSALGNSHKAGAREKLTPQNWNFGRWLAERRRGGVNRLSALLHLPLGPLRRIRQRSGRVRDHATSQSGDRILIASMVLMRTITAGARKILTSSCVCYMPAFAARMACLRPACSIFGMPRLTVRNYARMSASLPRLCPAIVSARNAAYHRFRARRQPRWRRAERWPDFQLQTTSTKRGSHD